MVGKSFFLIKITLNWQGWFIRSFGEALRLSNVCFSPIKLSCRLFLKYNLIQVAAPLASRGVVLEVAGWAEKYHKNIPMLQYKYEIAISGPLWSFPKMDNSITSVVNDLLSYRQKIPTTLYNTKGCTKMCLVHPCLVSKWVVNLNDFKELGARTDIL